jgi:glutamate/tyrosine decarboxylase-like PLP-dependent enzyme
MDKKYLSWKMRRQILADRNPVWTGKFAEYKVAALVIVENIDWSTGKRTFQSEKHKNNWLNSLAMANGAFSGGKAWGGLYGIVLGVMEENGYLSIDGLSIQLMQKEDVSVEGDAA